MSRIRRPRYRRHRKHDESFQRFLADMEDKWDGEETAFDVTVVDNDVLTLSGDPGTTGPLYLRGVPPVSLRGIERFWLDYAAGDATVYSSRAAQASGQATPIAEWDLAPTWDALGTPIAVTAVTNGADTITIPNHGLVVGDGPFYIASDDTVPAGLAATTPYWVQAVPTVSTLKLSATKGGAAINISSDGAGNITLVPVNVDISLDTIEIVDHGMETGDGPVQISTTGTRPTGTALLTDYWVIKLTDDRFKVATTRDLALAGTPVNITGIGAGTSTLERDITVGKDFTADGILEWLNQGVTRELMQNGDTGDVDTIFP